MEKVLDSQKEEKAVTEKDETEKSDSKVKTRDCSVDLMRIIACCLVIGVHTNYLGLGNYKESRILWTILLGDGVAIFFTIMGFFLFKNKSFSKLLKKTFVGIILPSMAILLLSEIIQPWSVNSKTLIECFSNTQIDLKMIIKGMLSWNIFGMQAGHLWYIITYFQIILMFPILNAIAKDSKAQKYVIILSVILLLISDIQTIINPPIKFTPYYLLPVAMVYVLMGHEIYENKDKIKKNYKLTIIFIVIMIISLIIRLALQINLFKREPNNNSYCYWSTGFAFINTLSIVMILLSLEIKNKTISNIISFIGQRTFVIYLIHSLVIIFCETRQITTNKLFDLFGINLDIANMSVGMELFYILIRIFTVFIISLTIAIGFYLIKLTFKTIIERLKPKKQLKV